MKNKGFTLIELMVAVAVFAFVVASASGLFAFSLKAQRRSIAYEQLLDQASYLAEYISRAVRMAQKDTNGLCTGTIKLNYAFTSPPNQCLKFRNSKNQCQQFCLETASARLKDENNNYLTSGDLKVLSFDVSLSGQAQSDNVQPKAQLLLDIQGKENSRIKIQTAISQRNLDVKR